MTYELEADNGIKYQLEGASARLKELFGHELEVTGPVAETAASDSSSAHSEPRSSLPKDVKQTIQVLDIKDLSSRCKAGK